MLGAKLFPTSNVGAEGDQTNQVLSKARALKLDSTHLSSNTRGEDEINLLRTASFAGRGRFLRPTAFPAGLRTG